MISPAILLSIIIGYFAILIVIAYFTGKNASNEVFFVGQRRSPWWVVAYGMIGGSLSGVTFISVPGQVGVNGYYYMQIVFGYMIGYAVIALILMPVYYRLNLASIYEYLKERFGVVSYKTGSAIFIVSRMLGASLRLYVGALVIYNYIFKDWGVPFIATVAISLVLIWIYTYRGGIKTIVWTDIFQTTCLLLAVIFTVWFISKELGIGLLSLPAKIAETSYGKMFNFIDIKMPNHFLKHFFGGAFIAMAMTGLDQDMMQKNLTCKTLGESQKNILWFSITLIFANLLILTLGALLYMYASAYNITLPGKSDDVFPTIALHHLPLIIGLFFSVGLVSTAYASADSALTALTTSFCVDFLGYKTEDEGGAKRNVVHVAFSIIMLGAIMFFYYLNDKAVIDLLFKIATFTYGPLLGLFAFGLFTKRPIMDSFTPIICVIAPSICFVLDKFSKVWFDGYAFGNELLILNGLLTFLGLLAISSPVQNKDSTSQVS